jgi:hypothetical protein
MDEGVVTCCSGLAHWQRHALMKLSEHRSRICLGAPLGVAAVTLDTTGTDAKLLCPLIRGVKQTYGPAAAAAPLSRRLRLNVLNCETGLNGWCTADLYAFGARTRAACARATTFSNARVTIDLRRWPWFAGAGASCCLDLRPVMAVFVESSWCLCCGA